MNKLKIEFLGVVGVVPTETGYVVAVPDIDNGWGEQPVAIEAHQPLMVVPLSSVIDMADIEPEFLLRTTGGRLSDQQYVAFRLAGVRVGFEGLADSPLDAPISDLTPASQGTLSPGPGEEQLLNWVPAMSDLEVPKAGRFKWSLVDQELVPDSNAKGVGLAAAIGIDRGRFFAEDVLRDENNNPTLHEFRLPSNVHNSVWTQALYSSLQWHADARDDRLTIRLTSQEGEKRVMIAAADGAFGVYLTNLEMEALVNENGDSLDAQLGDRDFRILYELSEAELLPNQEAPIPFRASAVGGSWFRCGGGRFDE